MEAGEKAEESNEALASPQPSTLFVPGIQNLMAITTIEEVH
jgi:hypothetical protein